MCLWFFITGGEHQVVEGKLQFESTISPVSNVVGEAAKTFSLQAGKEYYIVTYPVN